jgi:hypothetical protein
MRLHLVVVAALVGTAAPACSVVRGYFAHPLPSYRPQDFAFEYSESGGMMPISTSLTCRAHTCRYQYQYMGRGEPVERTVTDSQLDTLYAAFRENAFQRITMTQHELVHDAGTTSVTLHADGHDYRVAPSATAGVHPWHRDRFRAVLQEVERFRHEMFGDVDRAAEAERTTILQGREPSRPPVASPSPATADASP